MKDAVEKDAVLIKAPIAKLQAAVNGGDLMGSRLDQTALKRFGVFIVKDHFDKTYIQGMADSFFSLLHSGEIKRSEFHKTEVRFRPDHPFDKILENTQFLDLASQFFNGAVALDFMRLIKKDSIDRDPVMLHQDSGYQVGRYDAFSLFIPLSECGKENGGLAVFPGTHNFGHLGDVGAIAPVLPEDYPFIQPTINVGDVLIMHAGAWHFSTPNLSGAHRVYLEVNIRSADDPAAKRFFLSPDERDWILNIGVTDLFVGSREQRIKALYEEVNKLKLQAETTKSAA